MGGSLTKPRFWDQLLQFIEEGRVIPILGRDLLRVRSGDGDVSLYAMLAKRAADYLDVDTADLPEGAELNAVACRFLDGPGRRDIEDVYAALKAVMPEPGELPVPDALVKLARIKPLRLFVTVTFDPLLEQAINQERFGGKKKTTVVSYSPGTVSDLPAEMSKLDRPCIFHLLGRLSVVPDYVVTDEDALEFVHALQSKSQRPELLFDEFRRQQLLLIGSGFPDWLSRFFIRVAAGEKLSVASGKNFVADLKVRTNERLREFLTSFSARTAIYEDGGPVEFVDELYRRWTERHPVDEPPAAAATGAAPAAGVVPEMEPGAVFLSYASEDRTAVEAIRDHLESAGVDVWFDKNALRAGDAYEDKIRDYIEDASLFVPVISSHSITAAKRFFRLEWTHAEKVAERVAPSEKYIIPVRIDDTDPTHETIPKAFRDLHCEPIPAGRCPPDFVVLVRKLYRRYQKVNAR